MQGAYYYINAASKGEQRRTSIDGQSDGGDGLLQLTVTLNVHRRSGQYP